MNAPRVLAAVEHEVAVQRRELADDLAKIASLAASAVHERTADEALRELPVVVARAAGRRLALRRLLAVQAMGEPMSSSPLSTPNEASKAPASPVATRLCGRCDSGGMAHELLYCDTCRADTCHRWAGRYVCEVCGR